MSVHGLLLAAGAGSRMGTPKALVSDDDGPWLQRGVRTLLDGGCDAVTVVLGAAVEEVLPIVEGLGVNVVVAPDWADGMSASLRAGLASLDQGGSAESPWSPESLGSPESPESLGSPESPDDADAGGPSGSPGAADAGGPSGSRDEAALVHLVDLPDVGPGVVRRVLGSTTSPTTASPAAALARATYAGVPGHPVLLGRDHWTPILAGLTGDRGARDYLRTHDVLPVECGDLATGRDVDSLG